MAIEVETMRIGNSIGIILPSEFVRQKKIRIKEKLMLEVVKEADFRDVFGKFKGKLKMSGQEFKDMVREGWD